MKKIDRFINQYSLSKTLQFKLIPYGKTLENFIKNGFLEQDMVRAEKYGLVKKYIDRYHKHFIDTTLRSIREMDVSAYAELFYKSVKTEKDSKELKKEEEKLRKSVADAFKKRPEYGKLFKKELIKELLPAFLKDEEELTTVEYFKSFTTYFVGFQENRQNMYDAEEKSVAIAYRCINDNLPKFLRNAAAFLKIEKALPAEKLAALQEDFSGLIGRDFHEFFRVDHFYLVLSQTGISQYNDLLGGYTTSDGKKVQGLNEYINLFNQTVPKNERLPLCKRLFDQILSDRGSISFLPEKFESDNEVIEVIGEYCRNKVLQATEKARALFRESDGRNYFGIWLKNDASLGAISQRAFGSWHAWKDAWRAKYDAQYKGKAKINTEKYDDEQEAAWKKTAYFSLGEIGELLGAEALSAHLFGQVEELAARIGADHAAASKLLSSPYVDMQKCLAKNDEAIVLIKNLMDGIKELERFLKCFDCGDAIGEKDSAFYEQFDEIFLLLGEYSRLYDKVRNYISQKPYSKEKVKLNFENSQFLSGWDRSKETEYRCALLMRNGAVYLAVADKSANKIFQDYPEAESNGWVKMDYKLLPGPNKMLPKVCFADSNADIIQPSKEILKIYQKGSFKKGDDFKIGDCRKMIAFYQEAIQKYESWREFGFDLKKPEEYQDISEFYRDVEMQGYKLTFKPISESYLNENIEKGNLYLFQLYNKDFSAYSKGTPNLHTMYFKMLFDERNLRNVVYRLNGGAEMFYRFPSIKDAEKILHPKGQPIKNKNPHTEKASSVFDYDIVKDKRFTEPQFSLHIPLTMNFQAVGNERINWDVRKALKDCKDNYVIGIDRGERHLLYVTVINGRGDIVEQFSLNQILNEYNGKTHRIDYHELLDSKERERQDARRNWQTVENIKELKEGYISQVVHKICELAVKYDAVIAMEDLNFGFKTGRMKVEKQVYQKFEKMLIDKLNYYVDKHLDPEEKGGLLHAYQLTEKFESFQKMGKQNGFIFYVPAWLTSKIDPTTGFVDLLKPKYTSVSDSVAFVEKFDSIRYNDAEDLFEFSFHYKNFPKGETDHRDAWTVCTNGDRIETVRDESANGNFVHRRIVLTEAWKKLFEDHGVLVAKGKDLKAAILAQTTADFYKKFMYLLRLTLQMRNSISHSEEDWLISPVRNATGKFYDSRKQTSQTVPENADANGAYHIAKKALWAIRVLQDCKDEDLKKVSLAISNKQWLEFAQRR